MKQSTLYDGLHLKYTGNMVTIYGLLASLIILILAAGTRSVMMAVIALIAVLGAFAGMIMELVATIKLRTEHDDYRRAFILTLINLLLGFVPDQEGVIGVVFSLIDLAIGTAIIWFFIRATNEFLVKYGFDNIAEKGDLVWKLTVALTVAGVVTSVLSLWSAITLVTNILVLIVSIVKLVIFVKYLNDSSEALKYLPAEGESAPPPENW